MALHRPQQHDYIEIIIPAYTEGYYSNLLILLFDSLIQMLGSWLRFPKSLLLSTGALIII